MSRIIIIPKHSPFEMVWVLFIWINVWRIHGSANRTNPQKCCKVPIIGLNSRYTRCMVSHKISRQKTRREISLEKEHLQQSVVISETKYIQAKIGEIYGAKSNKMFQIFRFERIFSLQCENPREISRQSTNIC